MSNCAQLKQDEILPGLDLDTFVRRGVDTGSDLSTKTYTAENLLRNHPEKYGIAARLLFYGVSKRFICEICKLNSRTVNAIELRETESRGAEILRNSVESKRLRIALLLSQRLEDLVSDDQALKSLDISTLIELIDRISKPSGAAKSSSAPVNPAPQSEPLDMEPANPSTEAYAQIYQFNGLDSKKKSAAREGQIPTSGSGSAIGPKVQKQSPNSVRESCNTPKSLGEIDSVDKFGDNRGEDDPAQDSSAPADDAKDHPPG